MSKTKYKPDQSDRDAYKIATTQGVKIYESTYGTWWWELTGVGNFGFETKYHAARDALAGLQHVLAPLVTF